MAVGRARKRTVPHFSEALVGLRVYTQMRN